MTCRTRAEAKDALIRAAKILAKLGVTLNREKTRIVHIAQGFEFLGFKIQRGKGQFKLTRDRIKSTLNRRKFTGWKRAADIPELNAHVVLPPPPPIRRAVAEIEGSTPELELTWLRMTRVWWACLWRFWSGALGVGLVPAFAED